VNFAAYVERTFNNLRTNFADEIPRKEFFNSYRLLASIIPARQAMSIEREAPRQGVKFDSSWPTST
jgi:hypothetical protein